MRSFDSPARLGGVDRRGLDMPDMPSIDWRNGTCDLTLGARSLLANDTEGFAIMNVRPLGDRIIVARVKEEAMTKGGIVIPDSAKEKPVEGKILAVGNGKVLEDGTVRKLDVKAGDTILFGKYAGTEVTIGGEQHLILREDDILGVVQT